MSLPDADELMGTKPKQKPCTRCDQPGGCSIWGHWLCYQCAGAWFRADHVPQADYPAWTAQWVAEFRKGAK